MSVFTCPRCGMTSHHPKDVENGYCRGCHDFTGKPQDVDIFVNGIVAARNGQPYIQLSSTRGMLLQLGTGEARKVAHDILIMCSRTEADAMVLKFLEKELDAPGEASVAMMQLFRNFRHEQDMQEVRGSSGPEDESGG